MNIVLKKRMLFGKINVLKVEASLNHVPYLKNFMI